MDFSEEQEENTNLPILVTDFGIVIEFRLKHSLKAYSPIVVTELGIVTDFKPKQA